MLTCSFFSVLSLDKIEIEEHHAKCVVVETNQILDFTFKQHLLYCPSGLNKRNFIIT